MAFWNKKKEQQRASELGHLQEGITSINEQMASVTENVTKLTRLQFKTSKTIEGKIDSLEAKLSTQQQYDALLIQNQQYEKQHDFLVQNTLHSLDGIDHVLSGISENEQIWSNLLGQWSHELVTSLDKVGVHQLDVLGKSFNPEVSESIKVVAKDSLDIAPTVPYQIMEVLKRGFADTNGQLIRKAHVITVKEDAHIERSGE